MNLAKTFIIAAIFGGAYTYWHHHHPTTQYSAAITSNGGTEITTNGFVLLPPAQGQNATTVYVVAAEECPHEDSQRADLLAKNLAQKGIPVERIHDVSFIVNNPQDNSAMQRVAPIMEGTLPVVFINGRAKSNPSLNEVVAEFNSNKRM